LLLYHLVPQKFSKWLVEKVQNQAVTTTQTHLLMLELKFQRKRIHHLQKAHPSLLLKQVVSARNLTNFRNLHYQHLLIFQQTGMENSLVSFDSLNAKLVSSVVSVNYAIM